MTPRPSAPLRARLLATYTRIRRARVTRQALRAGAAAIVLLVAAVTSGLALPRTPLTASLRLALFVVGGLVALGLALRTLQRESSSWDAWLESLEARFPELRSWLRNALDLEAAPDANTSGELAGAVRDEAGRRVAETPLDATIPSIEARRPSLVMLAATASLAAAAFLAPAATHDAWRTLWSPSTAAPPITLRVEPGSVVLTPGAAFAVRARVSGSTAAPRLLGEGASPAAVLESSDGDTRRWRFDLPPVTRARDYAVKVAAVTSPRYAIALSGEPRPVSFAAAITAPGYARLPVQRVSGTRGDLTALAGSSAAIEVTFDRDLESLSAAIGRGPALAWSAITPRRWRGTLPLRGEGTWALHARATTGEGVFEYRLSLLPDAPPVIAVTLPVGDLDLPAGQLIPYDVSAQDDLGISELRLEWRKDAGDPWREQVLARFAEEPREARATARWDASPLALLPGESGVFRFVALDNARPGAHGRATSGEFRVRFPSLKDLYASLDQKQDRVAETLERAKEQTRELQKSLDKLQHQPPTQASQTPSFERAAEVKKTAERQQNVAEQVKDAAKQMRESLEQAAERQAFQEQLQRKLKEMSELLQQVQSEEFKSALKRMQDALEKMDRRAMEESIPKLQQENRDMMQQLQRSLELLKQLREEERLEALAQRGEELQKQQDELNREHGEQAQAKSSPSAKASPTPPTMGRPSLKDRQQQAAEASRELARDAQRASQQSEDPDAKQRLQKASEELEQNATQQQKEATQRSDAGDSQGAQSAGQKASQSLGRASSAMRQGAQAQQQAQDARNLAAVRRASQDLVSLSRASQENLDPRKPTGQAAESQTDLSDGVARVTDSLMTLSQQTPFMSNKVLQSLGQAMQGLSQSGREMSQGQRDRGASSGRGASSALNEAVKGLRAAEASMCQQPGSGSGGKSSSQRLGEVGERQSQLNRRSREVARRLSQQMSLAEADAGEMRRLAEEQARIREQLEDIRRDEEAKKSLIGGLEQAQKDMQQSEERLREGRMDEDLEAQQTRILSRLLDASRSMNRRDFDPEREARRGEDVEHASPGALAKDLFRENDRLRQDLLKADADRVPARYRALIEAYLRSLDGTPR